MANNNLRNARKAKNDEFYTTKEDIENELSHYKHFFRNKIVYCNCDDPEESEFWKFFTRVFKDWEIKKLIATHYEPNDKNFAYKLELKEGAEWDDTPIKTPIICNGDFRNEICIELLKEADIIVTNPPFSLFRQFVAQLIEYDKKFLIIGNKNAINYKEIFPLIKDNKIWFGYTSPKTFKLPNGEITNKLSGLCRWFTNLDINKRYTPLDLRGNYYSKELYPQYDNYDAIEVSKVANIPSDYYGNLAVPISFIDHYCPSQFQILGCTCRGYSPEYRTKIYTKDEYENANDLNGSGCILINGKLKTKYGRLIIRRIR